MLKFLDLVVPVEYKLIEFLGANKDKILILLILLLLVAVVIFITCIIRKDHKENPEAMETTDKEDPQ